ncbi:MAG: aspartate--tRNA(Asn) ligase [Spirochaetes bacterium GWD1_27_9]|nr:MAG: aspartate--tRNA(Asn) ligase [Spirochaetes bacterium GWC1_27_15]OHD32200.1 MAG: aspartate--tRNA(Asn) ligase [Spirochaetes bacterium GWD1_27_9]
MKELKINPEISSYIDFSSYEGKEIELTGMIQNLRILAWGGFLILRTANYIIQTVCDKNNVSFPLETLTVEQTVKIKGLLQKATIKDKSIYPRDYEVQVREIEIISSPSVNPLPVDTTKKELNAGLDTKLDLRPLTLRHAKQRAIFKISSVIYNEFGNYLTKVGFTRICSPKIVFSGAEGGANIFKIDYFKRNAYLAQSPQFYKQMMVGVFGRVFEEAPVFRAEEHDTSRHLNEYISLDFEMMLQNGFEDLIVMETNVLRHIFDELKKQCQNEIELLEIELPSLEKIVCLKFSEVHEIVFNNFKKDFRSEKDLAPEEERLICEYAKKEWGTEFVFITHYPTEKRPFYAMSDSANPAETLSFDLLFRGIEITTGGQRLNKYEDYIAKMTKLGMNVDSFNSYLQAFKFGMPPHGGLGLGLERLTAQICKLSNVKEASLFPRDINRLEP